MAATQKPSRVVFTGDFLRPNVAGTRPTQHYNIRWLHNLLSTPIAQALPMPQNVFSWGADNVRDGKLTQADVENIYRALGLPTDIRSWATIFGLGKLPERVEALFYHWLRDSLVVAFELPPYLENFLTRHNLPFISATVHPVRFLDDIFLGFRTNIPEIQDALFSHAIDENYIHMMAGVQKASASRLFREQVKPNSALFIMQTWYDQTQICDSRFIDMAIYLEEVAALAAQHAELLVKEHPLDPNPSTAMLMSRVPNARRVSANVYSYLSLPEIKTVMTLSSSVGVEAPYFGVQTHFLLRDPVRRCINADDDRSDYIGIQSAFLNPDFWREILSPLGPVTPVDGITVPFKPNRLRISMRSFWNFNEIDTDITSAMGKK
jgi:hypothetical protein